MSKSPVDLRSLPLHDLLSAPVTAAMQAQEQASLEMVSLIQDVGFVPGERGKPPVVRTVEFRYVREGRDEDGKAVSRETRLRVPLLAMISLPNLEIERLSVNCLATVQAVGFSEYSPQLSIANPLKARYPFLRGHASLQVAPAARSVSKGAAQAVQPHHLEVTLTMTNEDPNDGVQRVLTALGGVTAEETR